MRIPRVWCFPLCRLFFIFGVKYLQYYSVFWTILLYIEHTMKILFCLPGTPQYVVATYDATSQVAQLYVNGNLTANETVPSYRCLDTVSTPCHNASTGINLGGWKAFSRGSSFAPCLLMPWLSVRRGPLRAKKSQIPIVPDNPYPINYSPPILTRYLRRERRI